MLEKFKVLIDTVKNQVFKRYPVTMALVAIGSIFLSIIVEYDYEKAKWIGKLAMIIWTAAAGTLLAEEIFLEEAIKRRVGYLLSALLAIGFTVIMSYEGKTLFGIETDLVIDQLARVYASYLAWLLVISVFHMYKESGHSFIQYCLRAAGGVVQTSVVYGIFSLGILLIVTIFDVLICETGDFLLRIETMLASCVYLAGVLLALSNTQKDVTRFFKVVVKYVLMPLTVLAFVIIYIYIAKLLLTKGLPSNEVFSILTALFCVGLPIWTVAANFDETLMGKAARLLPYAFLPFTILQIVCVGMRIGQYGLTQERYLGCFFILFELIYVLLYACFHGRYLPYILYVFVLMGMIYILAPVLRYDDMVYLTQKHTLESFLELDEAGKNALTNAEQKRLVGAFFAVQDSTKGIAYIDKMPESDTEWIKACGEAVEQHVSVSDHFISASISRLPVDVSGYQTMYEFYEVANDKSDAKAYEISFNDERKLTIDISAFLKDMVKEYEADSNLDMDKWLEAHNALTLPDGNKIVIKHVYLHVEDDSYEDIDLEGYYLFK